MIRTRRWTIAGILMLSVAAAAVVVTRRQARIDHLAAECPTIARIKDWPRLEARAREWLDLQSAPAAWFWLGTSLKEQRQFADAGRAFENVPRDGLRGIDAVIERMEIQYHVFQRPLEALQLARELLAIDPRLASPRRHRIHFYAMTMQRPELIREIRLAITHRVDLPEHYLYLISLEDLTFRDAEEVTRGWFEASPHSRLLRQVHAMHRLRNARATALSTPTPDVVQRFRALHRETIAAAEKEPQEPVVLDTLLLLAMDDADVEQAGRLLALISDEATGDPVFWRYRGWYAALNGDSPLAAESYRQALKLHPLAWQSRHEYANLLRLSGETEEAGKVQTLAAQGSALASEIRRLSHVRHASPELLARLARYARDVGDWEVANGIVRRSRSDSR
jgi:tetratricopeptide (TPR) repeat protein